jgi:hypothetical protein
VVRVPVYRSGGPGFDSRHYKKKVVDLEQGPLSLVSTTEELLESREYGRRDSSRWPRGTLYPQKVGTNFADKRRSLGRYSSLADSGHGIFMPNSCGIQPLDALNSRIVWTQKIEGNRVLWGGKGRAVDSGICTPGQKGLCWPFPVNALLKIYLETMRK